MKAVQARALAYEKNTNDSDSQYSKIKTKIILEAKNGNYEMMWYHKFNVDVRNKLLEEEYIVGKTSYDQRDGDDSGTTKISW